MATPESATCPADVSTGLPHADVIMAFDDASVDLVNIDQVNGSTGSTSLWGPHVSGTGSLTSGSRVSGRVKRKRKAEAVLGSKQIRPARSGPRNVGSGLAGRQVGSGCSFVGQLGSAQGNGPRLGGPIGSAWDLGLAGVSGPPLLRLLHFSPSLFLR